LQISAEEYISSATLLSDSKLFYLAAVCIVKAKSAFANPLEQENKVLSLAMAANKQKKQKETVSILGLFKQQFPKSKHIPKVSALLK